MGTDFEETREFDSASIPRLGPGTVLNGRYRLESEVGRGAMGVVFRATDLTLRREVAVKALPEAAGSSEARERLLREARAAAALNHPRIVSVHDVGEHYGMPFFVMELIEGESLGQAKPKETAEIVGIARQILEALDHAHRHAIVHRDLKPENVLLAGGKVKLADLGLAASPSGSQRITGKGAIVGTASYMAPEQALGQTVDGRADLYALGVMLYELTTGRLPFVGDHPLAVVSQHVHAPVVPPRAICSSISPAVDAVILKLLAKDPAHRFATASDASAALEQALEAPGAGGDDREAAAVALLNALSRGRLVARDAELADAREIWRRARDGSGHFLLVSGEPGSGKTRFARELLIQAAVDGATVLTGACYEYEAATPYLPFAEAFRKWVAEQKDDAALRAACSDAAPRLAKLAPEIEARLGPFPERQELSPHEERLLFFDAVVQALRAAARARGVLLYVDDLHWADSASLQLLGHLLRALREERVLFLASYREIELDRSHPLSKALVDWNRERLTTRLLLKRFDAEGTRAQLSTLLGQPIGPEFAGAVYRETEGNPFFVEEVLKALIEQGAVRREGGRWERCEMVDLAIPQSVKAAIGHRLDRVKPESNEVLRAAAVLGKTFAFQDLLAVAGDKGEDALLDALDEAVCCQLIVAGRDDIFAFTHDKIREVLYEELNPIRRRRLHLRTAEGLEKPREGRTVPVEKLAHHYIEAGEHERGLLWARKAGAEAERLFAYDEAIDAYGRAIECAQALGREDDEGGLEEAIGRARVVKGDLIAALTNFDRALALTRDPGTRARLQTLAANSLVTLGDPRGLEYARASLEVLDPVTQPFETAYSLGIQGRFHHLAGRHREAAKLLENAVQCAEAAVKPGLSVFQASTLASLYGYLSGAYQHLALFDDADRWARRSIAYGRAHNVPLAEAIGYEFLGENAANNGKWREGLEYAEREREIADRLHSRERRAWSCFYAGECARYLGEAAHAEDEYRTGIELATATGERRLGLLLSTGWAQHLADVGRFDEALEEGRQAIVRADALNMVHMRTEARRAKGYAHYRRGELEDAIRLFDEVLEITRGLEPKVSRLLMGPFHVEALRAAGRDDEAKARLDEYAALVRECQSPHASREVERLRG
ncbi:MAG TPA: AAA family ATPase [Candidatus Polarisedimenticolaceae bacterium]|nr:AAA family ATPase [Candidatus Polarisedimenticolaceae bacterium]